MNKKGQGFITGLGFAALTAFIFFMAGMVLLNFVTPEVTQARTDLSCTVANISDGSKLSCLAADATVPVYIIGVLSIAGGMIVSKFLL